MMRESEVILNACELKHGMSNDSQPANPISLYENQLLRIIEAHTPAHRIGWTDTMQELEVLGFDAVTRNFDLAGFDDEACDSILIRIQFPLLDQSKNVVRATCSCDESNNSALCRHTYAALQLVTRLLRKATDPLTKALSAKGAQAAWARSSDQSGVAPKLLSALDQVLKSAEPRTADSNANRRLVYRLQLRRTFYGPSLTVVPAEQELKKDGLSWKKGRLLRWEELSYRHDLINSSHDDAVRSLLRKPGNTAYLYSGPPTSAILMALAGSNRIILEDEPEERPVDVRVGVLGLTCRVDQGKLHVELTSNGEIFDRRRGLLSEGNMATLIALGHETVTVITAPNQQSVVLASEFIKTPVAVPLEAAVSLIERLAKLDAVMPVKLPDELFARPIEADQRIHLELIPSQPQGLFVRFRVQPLPSGPIALPGDGRNGSYHSHNGRISRVLRNLGAERERVLSIAKELEIAQWSAITEWDWRVPSDDAVIDFLAKLADRQRRRLASLVPQDPTMASSNDVTAPAALLGSIPATDDLVVSWPQGGSIRITSEIGSSSLRLSVEDREDWFGLNGTIQVDGQSIPLQALINALKAGRKYIPLGNGVWARISDEFLERLEAIGDLVHSSKNGLEIDITAASALQDLIEFKEHIQLCAKWRNLLSNLDASAIQNSEPPLNLNANLRHYQIDGYRWLKRLATWGVGGCLADDMGLGKTVQALAVLLDRRETGPALVIAPMSVGFNWARETRRFAPSLNVVSYRDSNRDQTLQELRNGDLVVVSYALFQRDAEKFSQVEWGTLILDEAQNVKNPTTKTARAVRDLNAKWRLALTGTPIENHLGELWALFRAISPGLFGSWERFRERFANPIEKAKDQNKRQSLARIVRPFILRRTKDEVLKELPPRTEILRTIELTSEERKRYEDARLAICTQLAGLDFGTAGKDHRFTVLAAITRLRQLACHPSLVDKKWTKSSSKLDAFMEIVDELREEQHRALVFSQFTQHLDLVRKALDLAKISYQYLDGSSSAAARQKSVDDFQAGAGDLFLISLKAGGSGLNLTAADYVIHLDPWWNPAVEDQATDRAHRMGQLRPVTVYRLVTESTIEEKILALHERKRELVASILDGTDEAAKLSTDELVDLIKGGSTTAATSDDVDAQAGDTKPRKSKRKPKVV